MGFGTREELKRALVALAGDDAFVDSVWREYCMAQASKM
jgi:hypothetical protein